MARNQAFSKRIHLLSLVMAVWAIAIGARLVYLQVLRHADFRAQAEAQQEEIRPLPAQRGIILDRQGRELAVNVQSVSLVINPLRLWKLTGAEGPASILVANYAGQDPEELRSRIAWHVEHRSGYLRVRKDLGDEDYAALRALIGKYEYLELEPSSRRFYPKGPLAAQIVGIMGFVEKIKTGPQGEKIIYTVEEPTVGVERSLDNVLRGAPGERWERHDAQRRVLDSRETPPRHGQDVRLTIDSRVQHVAQQALAEAVKQANAKTATAVVMDVNTGDILAMASHPGFDPNTPPKTMREVEGRLNLAISAPYEPGSVFKAFTFAALADTAGIRDEEMINCGSGAINLYGKTVRDHHSYSSLSIADVLAKSSNVGTITLALRVGPKVLHEYLTRFGFGRGTGIDLPAEDSGKLWPLQRWKIRSVGYVSIGHEVTATTLQLARGFAALGNGGYLVQPRIVLDENAPVVKEQVIKTETSFKMRRLLERVVLSGTGRGAKVAGFSAAGKTGSAQIYDYAQRVYTHRYNASFVGFAPANDPRIVVAVSVHDSDKFGGSVAAPAFSAIASEALTHMKVVPDMAPVDNTAIAQAIEPDETADAAELGVALEEEAAELALYPVGPRTPDFTGLSKHAVLSLAVSSGLPVQAIGRGVAKSQTPAPGRVLPPGGRVEVLFTF